MTPPPGKSKDRSATTTNQTKEKESPPTQPPKTDSPDASAIDNGHIAPDPSFIKEAVTVAKRVLKTRPSFVVGIGASAGGLVAIEDFFHNVPEKSGLAYVVIQHLSPDFKSLMDEILARHTHIPIHRAENEMLVQQDAIYLIPPKKDMIIANGKLLLTERDSSQGINLPIDVFFRSLALDYKDHAIAIILSGTGSDGSRGVSAVHEAGGFVLVQDRHTAKFDNMPRAAVATGMVDVVERPAEMPETILRYIKHPQVPSKNTPLGKIVVDEEYTPINDIFQLLRLRFEIDFNHYKPTTIDRRLGRRMAICRCTDLEHYVQYLNETPAELNSLYHDLLIGVTRFYRDPKAFECLEREIIPNLFDQTTREKDELRVWVPACATGEEAYSLAISLAEHCWKHNIDPNIKIFATDVHKESLDTASTGLYKKEEVEEILPKRLQTHFIKEGKSYRISREIRKMVIFAPHNLISDPPFTKIDLISCRNLLIYFEPPIQQNVLSLFHFALNTNGYLFLGSSESLGEIESEFEEISSKHKFYRKRRDVRLTNVGLPTPNIGTLRLRGSRSASSEYAGGKAEPIVIWAYESLLGEYVSSGLLIDQNNELIHVFGDAKQYLLPFEGRPSTNLMDMVSKELGTAVTAAVHRTDKSRVPVVYHGVKALSTDEEGERSVRISISPLLNNKRSNAKYFFISIEKIEKKIDTTTPKQHDIFEEVEQLSTHRVSDLEVELQYTRENLQTANEELEATNEELIAANEELQSTNEEIQSTNEELQSTNEELHSVNEELHTVNTEYQKKIDELTQLTNDVENLLTSTEIGTVFLDNKLNIRKYTPAVAGLFNLLPRDVGRPITHISSKLKIDPNELTTLSNQVINSGSPLEGEVQMIEGQWVLMRVLPYRDESHNTGGIVLTFLDITITKEAQLELNEYTEKLETSNQDLQDFAYVASHDLQAPLRSIINFSGMLEKGLGQDIEEQARDDLGRVQSAAQRMQRLIDDLLEFSRVNSRGKEFEKASCSDVLNTAIENLNDQIKETNADIQISLLPALLVDKTQLTQLFQNLIGNAMKFRDNHRNPQIKISATHEDHDWIFSVKDNGIGIPEERLSDVFIIFRRLHSEKTYPGTGLGLAICKRIVERHHGRIWVESTLGQGCTFYFSIPTHSSL